MTPGERVAQVAHEVLDVGPMSKSLRRDDYKAFIHANFVDTPQAPVLETSGTNCAIFARACLTQAGIMPVGKRPRITAITTWLGVQWFRQDNPDTELIEGAWIPVDQWTPEVGDIPYICGGSESTWWSATNGHVFILTDGSGPIWSIAQGGGGSDGSLCRISRDVNIFEQSRTVRGAWRPALILARQLPPPAFEPLQVGSRGLRVAVLQRRLLHLQYSLPRWGADSIFGAETHAAVAAFQSEHTLPVTGVVDAQTWQRMLDHTPKDTT